jgi:hypothetical protein
LIDVALGVVLLLSLGISGLFDPVIGGALALAAGTAFWVRLIQLNARGDDLGTSLWTRRVLGFYSGLILGTVLAIVLMVLISFEGSAPLALWVLSLPFFYYGAEFLHTRRARSGITKANQADDPFLFWLLMATPVLASLFLTAAGVYFFGCTLRSPGECWFSPC